MKLVGLSHYMVPPRLLAEPGSGISQQGETILGFTSNLGSDHLNVIRDGSTSIGSKEDRLPGTDSFVVKKAEMVVEVRRTVWSVPAMVRMVNV